MVAVFKLKRLPLFLLAVIIVLAGALCIRRASSFPVAAMGEAASPTLIIDPGHGGEDGGAVSASGAYESVINLDISLKTATLAEFFGFPALLTREDEALSYPERCKTVSSRKRFDQQQRVEFINATENAVVLSVHQNSFPSAVAFGPQAFYTSDEYAESFGRLVQEHLNIALCPENRRVAAPAAKNIYLMKSINCPGVLAECGFLSNKNEARLLETEEYRLKTACALISAYTEHISTNEETL